MRHAAVTLALLAACNATSSPPTESHLEQLDSSLHSRLDHVRGEERILQLPLDAGDTLVIEQSFGNVTVRASDQRTARLKARIEVHTSSERNAETVLGEMRLQTERTPRGLVIRMHKPDQATHPGDDTGVLYSASADYDLVVPEGTRLDVRALRGDVGAHGPFGASRIETNHGSIALARVDGGATVVSRSGDVTLEQARSGKIKATTEYGALVLRDVTGNSIDAVTTRGHITLEGGDAAAIHVRSSHGTLTLENTRGVLEAETSSGSVSLNAAEGQSLSVHSGYGEVTVEDANALKLNATGTRGRITLRRAVAETFSIRSAHGSLELERLEGRLDAHTESGHVTVRNARGPQLTLYSGYGDFLVEDVAGALSVTGTRGRIDVTNARGSVSAESSHGAMSIEGAFANVTAKSTSGDIELVARKDSAPAAGWSLESGYGHLALELPASLSCDLEVATRFGSIESDFPLAFEAAAGAEGSSAVGKVRGGGPLVRLETSRGNIAIRKSAP